MRWLMHAAAPMKPRVPGFNNDMERFAAIEELPLSDIRCPTLITHGTADGDVPFKHAEDAYQIIPDSQLHRMENGWHLLWLSEGADEMVRRQIEFVKAHSESSRTVSQPRVGA